MWAIREKVGLFRKASHDPIQLTTGPVSNGLPVPSKDGKKIFVLAAQPIPELVRYDLKSGEFLPYLSGIAADLLHFSRDGKWVAYVTVDGKLFRSKLDGGQRLELSFPPMAAAYPHWSPDGKQLAFMGREPGKPWQTYVVSAEGGSPQNLMPSDHNQGEGNWSPDGNSLIFGGFSRKEAGTVGIRFLDLRTHGISKLPGSEGLYAPRWSPDGRYIAALQEYRQKLVLMDFKSRQLSELAKANIDNYAWSWDGKYIYFDTWSNAFYRVRISDRKVEQIPVKNVKRAPGIMGEWMGLAPDGSILLLRDAGIQDIYALDWEAP